MQESAWEHERLSRRSSGKASLEHAISAVECYMRALDKSTDPVEQTRLSRKCKELLTLSEGLKKLQARTGVASQTDGPRCLRKLPTAEKIILLRSSKLNGHVFAPWEQGPDPKAQSKSDRSAQPFSDPWTSSFSPKQQQIFNGWKRAHDLIDTLSDEPGPQGAEADQFDLVQDVTTDCSVVASLCAAMRYLRPGEDSMLSGIMWPYEQDKDKSHKLANGEYVFRFNFNGCFRKVTIDDRLPSSRTTRSLFVVDRFHPRSLWPALLEKAYLKIRGGYDFPGSNSGTDLWALTGWIPEQVFLSSVEFEEVKVWKQMTNSFAYGEVMITLGTGRLDPAEEDALGLAGEHDYAVLDVETLPNGSRRMLLKNPWCDGLVWTSSVVAKTGIQDREAAVSDQLQGLSLSDKGLSMTGTFWIDYEDVTANFESMYLNWKPSLFKCRQDHHFRWDIPDAVVSNSLLRNPQYAFSAPASGSVWVLLSRHYQDLEPTRRADTGHIALYSFDQSKHGKRVSLPTGSMHPVHYVDSPQTLSRLDVEAGQPQTIVAAQMGLPSPSYSFTLSFFSQHPLQVAKAQSQLQHQLEVEGAWTYTSAGGNASSFYFYKNPQYVLKVDRLTKLNILLTSDRDDLPLQVALVWAEGKRVTRLVSKTLICSSGEYQRRYASVDSSSTASGLIDPGLHAVVVSTFEPRQLARFLLHVESDHPVTLSSILEDTAGRFIKDLGPVRFPQPNGSSPKRARCALSVPHLARASFMAHGGMVSGGSIPRTRSAPSTASSTPSMGCSVRMSLEFGQAPYANTIASTSDGDFADVSMGLRIEDVDLLTDEMLLENWYKSDNAAYTGSKQPGPLLWLVLEELGSGCEEGLFVEILSEEKLTVGDWEFTDY